MNRSGPLYTLPALPVRALNGAMRLARRLGLTARDLPFHLDRYLHRRDVADAHAVAAARAIGGTISIDDLVMLRSELGREGGTVVIDADRRDVSQLRTLLNDLSGLTVVDGSAVAVHDRVVLISTSDESDLILRARVGIGPVSRLLRVRARQADVRSMTDQPPTARRGHVVILNDFGFRGRAGEAMRRQALAFLLEGWQVTVACWQTDAHLSAPSVSGVNIDGLWKGYRGLYRFYPRSDFQTLFVADVVQAVREQKPDLVLFGRFDGVPYPEGIAERIRSLGIPIIPYMHDRPFPKLLPASLATAFGLDEALFAPLPRATARRLLGITDDRPLAVMRAVAAGDAHHDAGLFEETRKALLQRRDIGLILFGPGSHLKKSTRSFGPVQQVLMPLIFSAADIFISTNVAETIGDTTGEAMACGLPVIAPRAGRIEEFVIDGETGLLVAPPTTAGLLAAVQSLVADAEARRRMGEAGRRRVEERFTLHHLAQEWRRALAALPSGCPLR
jgi:hypothetical protein